MMATAVLNVPVPSRELLRVLRHASFTINNATASITRSRGSRSIRLHTELYPSTGSTRCISSTNTKLAESRRFRPPQYEHAGGQSPSPSPSSSAAQQDHHHRRNPYAPTTRDRGPESKEDTQTDFGAMDIYSNTPEPATSIDACTPGGFHLNNGSKITGGSGVLLVGGEAFSWKPWVATVTAAATQAGDEQTSTPPPPAPRISNLLDPKSLLSIPPQSLSIFKYIHPKPDLLLIGTGSRTLMLHPDSRKYIVDELGMRIDVMDTANASAAYNLLAKERGVDGGGGVGGAMLPVGWRGVPLVDGDAGTKNNKKKTIVNRFRS